MKKRLYFLPRLLLVVFLCFDSATGYGASASEWYDTMHEQMNLLLRAHFVYLAKDFTDLQTAIAWKIRQQLLQLAILQNELGNLRSQLERSGSTDSRLLREFAFRKSEIDLLAQLAQRNGDTFTATQAAWHQQCAAPRIDELSQEFSVDGLTAVRQILIRLNAAIDEAQKTAGNSANINLHFSMGTTNGSDWSMSNNIATQTSSSDWKDAVSGAVAGGLSFVNPILGIAVGVVVRLILQIIDYKSARTKANEALLDQVQYVLDAVDRIRPTLHQQIQDNCTATFQYKTADADLAAIAGAVKQDLLSVGSIGHDATAQAVSVELDTKKSLADLGITYSTFARRFDRALDGYFAQRQKLGTESLGYFSQTMLPRLDDVLAAKGGVAVSNAHEKLWDAWIDGDARYRGEPGFGFVEPSSSGLLYWDTATRALHEQLEGE